MKKPTESLAPFRPINWDNSDNKHGVNYIFCFRIVRALRILPGENLFHFFDAHLVFIDSQSADSLEDYFPFGKLPGRCHVFSRGYKP